MEYHGRDGSASGKRRERRGILDLLARGRKRGIMPDTDFANVAQLVEQRFRKPQVVGSIPTVGSNFQTFRRNELESRERRPVREIVSSRRVRSQGFYDGCRFVTIRAVMGGDTQ